MGLSPVSTMVTTAVALRLGPAVLNDMVMSKTYIVVGVAVGSGVGVLVGSGVGVAVGSGVGVLVGSGVGVPPPLPGTRTGVKIVLLLTSSSGSCVPSPESSVQLKLPALLTCA